MSKLLKPTSKSERNIILQNVNAWVAIHDITCNCDSPLKCIILQIYRQEPTLSFKPKELQKWLTTTDLTAKDGGEEEDIDGKELDALFASLEKEDAKG